MTANSVNPSHREFDPSNPLSSFANVLHRVALHPVAFFAALPRRGSLRNPFLFALICIVIGNVLNAVVELLGVETPQGFSLTQDLLAPLGLSSQSLAGFVASIVISVVIGIIFLPVLAGIYQLLVRIVVGSENTGFEATFRVVAYSDVVLLVSWIPILGTLLALYSLYLQFAGLREVHETITVRAILVVLLFFVVTFLLGFGVLEMASLLIGIE